MLQASSGKMERHEYLGALKAGSLEESAQFQQRYQEMKKRYAFPEDLEKAP